MATATDLIATLLSPSRTEMYTWTARPRIPVHPAKHSRPARQPGDEVLGQRLPDSGVAAYARQQERYERWKDSRESRPVRAAAIGAWAYNAAEATGKGTQLDVRL